MSEREDRASAERHGELAPVRLVETARESSELAHLTAELEQLRRELAAEHRRYLRALADFDNYRKRIERELSERVRDGMRKILLEVLQVLDAFENVLGLEKERTGTTASPTGEALQLIHRQLVRLLEACGVRPYESLGRKFDPALHEAIEAIPSHEHEEQTIVREVRKGYRWGDQILRPAHVVVAVAGPSTQGSSPPAKSAEPHA
ncbi:MAG: nucleotide exchange factor GrpE [Blastocatellia bacterium]|nr:nucleotide exchange factor GrpE [Blastocatellia bacterium]MCS7157358.1 nucleotide exchange factor GrpE [Blastocatellia bacterium]MCX7753224.1 nucleotide exchange factor GrpE [Blastocatellia bacterium]MDW8168263.1 nucleotide exchange factor GrpE [Acidobacteriota bacterium]MDW8255444.1 nucleotide exchange factor GrpE [Acidobacteriota bacterium]